MKVEFPIAVDSTIMAAFRSCPQKMLRTYLEHWKPKTESVHLVAGGAFAKGIEVARKAFFEGLYPDWEVEEKLQGDGTVRKVWYVKVWLKTDHISKEDAEALGLDALMKTYGDFECPPESAKSLERTAGALAFYYDQYPLGQDGLIPIMFSNGKKAIEFSFAEPLPFQHPVTGDPVLYTGRADLIGEFAGGIYIVDEKTTSSLGASWSRQWEMRGQFTGYQWASKQANIKAEGTIIRGVSILKTKYDTQQALTYRASWEIDRWLEQTVKDLQRMQRMWEEGWFDFAMDSACAEYGGCSLLQVCKAATPEDWLHMNFERRKWDPLKKEEILLGKEVQSEQA